MLRMASLWRIGSPPRYGCVSGPANLTASCALTSLQGLLALQSLSLIASHSPTQAYSTGLYLALSAMTATVVLLLQDTAVLGIVLKTHAVSAALRIVVVAATACLMAASLVLPRRPDVFYNGRVVDRESTVNAYLRFTFSWSANVLATAKEKQDLDVTDLPRPSHYTRSADLATLWKSQNYEGPLWKSLLWTYKGPLILQWFLCIVGSALAYLPYWVTLQLLKAFENRKPGQSLGVEVWFLVVWMGFSVVAQSVRRSPEFVVCMAREC